MFNTWFILTETHGNQACILEVVHEATQVNKQFILGVGGMVNKPRLHVLVYPGKPLVCLGFSGMAKWPCL